MKKKNQQFKIDGFIPKSKSSIIYGKARTVKHLQQKFYDHLEALYVVELRSAGCRANFIKCIYVLCYCRFLKEHLVLTQNIRHASLRVTF